MRLGFVHLPPNKPPTQLPSGPLIAVIISEITVTGDWRNGIAQWLVNGGCLYAIAWGTECEKWHDAVDWAVLDTFGFGDIPDDKFVMTTWQANESMSEALWFAGNCAFHPDVELQRTVLIHVADQAKPEELIATYAASQVLGDE